MIASRHILTFAFSPVRNGTGGHDCEGRARKEETYLHFSGSCLHEFYSFFFVPAARDGVDLKLKILLILMLIFGEARRGEARRQSWISVLCCEMRGARLLGR